ncbi:hypothetical protein Oweho_1490 [Owenweeksia hongkongensis DSM 17368]|uniref:Uncharacterized protein n=1 Tax=Owenweeksia hongkongensis (strain DSM 17368 / CIP 108786 / JCM 12287 / NRRL B-23963 / UST20020801) TaxID=926562 RepID=G8R8Q1_OWEHD|nr:hypothetical protein Oweho_1490 [Owenweeksia hongkongensis DSM 17368]
MFLKIYRYGKFKMSTSYFGGAYIYIFNAVYFLTKDLIYR